MTHIPAETDALPTASRQPLAGAETALGRPRDLLGNRFIYAVISARARGLSIGVNMNPDKKCNFDCVYCEVNRCFPGKEERLDLPVMAKELEGAVELIRSGKIAELPFFRDAPRSLLQLRQVALSGDGEPTLNVNFTETVQTVAHVRARSASFFKIVLITNSTGLDIPGVQEGLKYFTAEDEIWTKLDAGTQSYFSKVNRTDVPIGRALANIASLARQRPVIIQSLFPSLDGQEPPANEIVEYAQRLKELKEAGALISLVQIYSATPAAHHRECGHLPLKTLARIAQSVRQISGLRVEIF